MRLQYTENHPQFCHRLSMKSPLPGSDVSSVPLRPEAEKRLLRLILPSLTPSCFNMHCPAGNRYTMSVTGLQLTVSMFLRLVRATVSIAYASSLAGVELSALFFSFIRPLLGRSSCLVSCLLSSPTCLAYCSLWLTGR